MSHEFAWLPMSVAPRDRSRVLLYRRPIPHWRGRGSRVVLIGYWTSPRAGATYWVIEGKSNGYATDDDLLGWMPLSALGEPRALAEQPQ